MRREEAVSIVKEIGVSCRLLNPREINLEASSLVGHYKIRVKSSVDDENWQCLKAIAKKYGLGIKLTDENLIIYKAQEGKGNRLVEV